MTLLVRKINKAKWHLDTFQDGDPVNADAITNCLKTSGNTLSFWAIQSEDLIEEAVLAIAASNDNLDTFDIVVLPISFFEENNFDIEHTPGSTKCQDLEDTHRDLAKLNVRHLAVLSNKIAGLVSSANARRYTLGSLKTIIKDAIEKGRIDPEVLPEGIKRKVLPTQ